MWPCTPFCPQLLPLAGHPHHGNRTAAPHDEAPPAAAQTSASICLRLSRALQELELQECCRYNRKTGGSQLWPEELP
eukprot:CAMPEP_0178387704 /NCGR_PEP_ID=MMETSP0689_2-20121128/9210_1 /TAXON_ID=160604 /ORGANISM="Amphidinium massartii, Strain CS-259" /LENGTH=76 /DNA_ID=CAMNT_0020008075 /DNA_START=13 /DNA_END=243 /DNA_ORIENTATION=-